MAVGIAAGQECGIDIQALASALPRVKERFVRPDEEELLANLSTDPLAALALLWCAKECLRKVVPIWPLLGFLECAATAACWQGNNVSIHFQPRTSGRQLPELPLVTSRLLGEYALGVSFL